MFCLTTRYRNFDGAYFDIDYYINTHVQLIRQRMESRGFLGYEIQRTVLGEADTGPEFLCTFHGYFTSLEAIQEGDELFGEELRADFANYTNISPEVHIGEVVHRQTYLSGAE